MTISNTTISPKTLASCLVECIKANIPAMAWGKPGIGKSDVVRQVAASLGYGLIDFRATLRDPVDLRGLPLVDAKTGTTRWLAPNELPNADRDGDKGILFLDELPNAPPLMQASCFGLVLDRQLGEYRLPEGWVPIAAGNRMADRSASQRMPSALKNRFAHFEVQADIDSWSDWANKAELNPLIIAFVRYRAELLHKMPEGDDNAFPTPRAWQSVSRCFDKSMAMHLRFSLVTGLVGPGPAAELEAFITSWTRLPPIQQIIDNPKSAMVPNMDEPGLMYAVSSAIARKATRETFGNVLTYAARLPKEFEILTAVDAVRRDPLLTKSSAFVQWAVRNQSVVV